MKAALEVLSTKLGALVRSQVLSILLPGSVVLLEIWTLADYPQLPEPVTSSLIPYPNIVGIVLFIYLAYVAGFCARQLSFFVAEGGLATLAFWSPTRPESGLPFKTRRWGERFYCGAAFDHNWNLLRATFGEAWIERIRTKHPFGLLKIDAGEPQGQSASESDYRELFHYCKYWLQSNRPQLDTVSMEVEFNLQLSVMLPVGLIPFVVLKETDGLLPVGLAALVSLAVIAVLVRRANHLRHAEVFNVLRNVLFAHWFSENVPPTPGSSESMSPGQRDGDELDSPS